MNCPICYGQTHVIDSRPNEDSIRRRRECLECKHRFSTVEIDTDYYEKLNPIDKSAVQKVMLDGFRDFTQRVFRVLYTKERNSKNEKI